MKHILALLSLFTCARAVAQDSLQSFADNRTRTLLTGMKVLGGWGIANLGAGAVGWATTDGSAKYFHQMSAIWGGVNLGVAALGFASAKKKLGQPLTATENAKAQKKIENTFLINAGLDVVYTGAGAYMKNRGNKKNNATLQGYGSSVMLQGIFLLVFDGVMYKLQRNNGNGLRRFLDKNSLAFDGRSIGVTHQF